MRDGWGAGPHPASPITHPVYSYLNASTGSSLAALLAGYRPNPMPVRAEAARAASTDQSGTCAGMGVRLATANATTPPASIPTASRINPLVYGTCLTNAPCGMPTCGGVAPLNRFGGGT